MTFIIKILHFFVIFCILLANYWDNIFFVTTISDRMRATKYIGKSNFAARRKLRAVAHRNGTMCINGPFI